MRLRSLFIAALLSITGTGLARADDTYSIFSKNTAWHVTGSDKLVVFGVADPIVNGVTCYYTAPQKGGFTAALGFATETSDVSLACRQVGPISFADKSSQGDDAFARSRSFFTKTLHISRGCDAKANVVVYMAYTDTLVDGSPKNSTSVVPIMPWGDSQTVVKCGDFIK